MVGSNACVRSLAVLLVVALAHAQAPAPRWQQLPPIGPFATLGVFAEPAGSIVVVGGGARAVRTWRWSGTWSEILPDPAPPQRAGSVFAYDAARGVGVLFGGTDYATYMETNDTWEFDGATWTLRSLPQAPPPRHDTVLGYDPLRQRIVLFGGQTITGMFVDTWEYDGNTWLQRLPPTSPSASYVDAMAWSSTLQKLLRVGLGAVDIETWTWDGTNWAQIPTAHRPPLRIYARLAHDPLRGRAVLFGGRNPFTFDLFDDTWEFDGTDWMQATPATVPAGRLGLGMTWSPVLQSLVLVGGYYGGVTRVSAAMHAFDGVDWHVVSPEAPFWLYHPALAFDSARDRLVLHGGIDEFGSFALQTWEWGNGVWQQTANGVGPHANLVYDPDRQCIVAVDAGVTWEYRANGWTPRTLVPAPATGPVWFDRHTRRVRCGVGSQLWTFDGNAWSVQPVVGTAVNALDAQTAHWSAHDVAVVTDGNTGKVFDGAAWQSFALASPTSREMVEDVLRGTLVTNDMSMLSTWWLTDAGWSSAPQGMSEDVFDMTLVADAVGGQVFGVTRGGAVWRLTWPNQASLARYGRGCPGSNGIPRLDPIAPTAPLLGAPVPMQLTSLPYAPGLGVLVVGDSLVSANGAPLPIALAAIGLPDCLAWVPIQAAVGFAHSGAQTQLAFTVPAVPVLAGVPLGLQAFVLDPTTANGLGAVSNALILIAR